MLQSTVNRWALFLLEDITEYRKSAAIESNLRSGVLLRLCLEDEESSARLVFAFLSSFLAGYILICSVLCKRFLSWQIKWLVVVGYLERIAMMMFRIWGERIKPLSLGW